MLKEITTGLSNKIFISESLKILIRKYGPQMDALVDRERERKIIKLLDSSNIGPKLLFEFKNGRVEELLDAEPISSDEYLSYQKIIINKLVLMHRFINLNTKPSVIKNIDSWTRLAEQLDVNGDYSKMFKYKDRLIRAIEQNASGLIVLCHNDLHYGNILLCRKRTNNSTIKLIDYEYADYNYYEFDIANHLIELNYHYNESDFCAINYSDFDKIEELFISRYHKNNSDKIVQLGNSLPYFKMASHYLWASWSCIKSSSQTSNSCESCKFPYKEYAEERANKFYEIASILLL
jgi:choline/ethanolamine kinase